MSTTCSRRRSRAGPTAPTSTRQLSPSPPRDDRRIGPDRHLPFTFVDDLDAPSLTAAEHHHLARVRRLRAGDPLTVGDGRGSFRRARFGDELSLDGEVQRAPRIEPEVAVGFALTKGDRPELVVQKLTELGVDRIVPMTTARTVVRWDDAKAARNLERWRAIARESAAQAHRPWLPDIDALVPFAHIARQPGSCLADPDGDPPSLDRPAILVGPEGGWTDEEVELVTHRCRLAPTILRAETAAIAAGALLVALRGG